MVSKLRTAVIFGGVSSEHEVSLVSAYSVISNIPADRYDVIKLGITREGGWFLYDGPLDNIPAGKWAEKRYLTPAILSPDRVRRGILSCGWNPEQGATLLNIDCVFPVLHGKNGEDGTLQGLLELSGIPYVGCGVAASANCMDKFLTHTLLEAAGVPTAPWQPVLPPDMESFEQTAQIIEEKLGYPVFVKPSRAGSSVGVSKAGDRNSLRTALETAFLQDSKVLVEKAIAGKEVECAVLGNCCDVSGPKAAQALGEIAPRQEFYSYSAKYQDDSTDLYIPARIAENSAEQLRQLAVRAYKAMGCDGLARVDFFVREDGSVLLNEINTLPGFTSISMYPKLWEASGTPYPELLDRLITLAMEKGQAK